MVLPRFLLVAAFAVSANAELPFSICVPPGAIDSGSASRNDGVGRLETGYHVHADIDNIPAGVRSCAEAQFLWADNPTAPGKTSHYSVRSEQGGGQIVRVSSLRITSKP